MNMNSLCVRRFALSVLMLFGITAISIAGDTPDFELKEGDKVLFLGNGYVENDQRHAYLETRLQRRFPGKALSFRYMGWSGDTVRGSARTAGFQVPQGLARLEKESLALKPTVIFFAYGMNESFDGPDAIPEFLRDYDKLLKTLAPLKARVVILSPTYHEDLGRPFPDPTEHNRHIEQYTGALKAFTAERKLAFIDLYHPLESVKKADAKVQLTTNGILLTDLAYDLAAEAAEKQLGYAVQRWEVTLDRNGKISESIGTKLSALDIKPGVLRFQASDATLPMLGDIHRLRISGLPPGKYAVRIDGHELLLASAAAWQDGLRIAHGPKEADTEKLREAIVLRNLLFYRRWRPYNDHSRHWGFIGGDFKLYDDEIALQEQRIAKLRSPQPHQYEIIRTGP